MPWEERRTWPGCPAILLLCLKCVRKIVDGDCRRAITEDDERMDEPATPPPAAPVEIENTVYITQMLRKLETDLEVLREKVNGIPKTVGETTRADIAELETRLTKSMGDSETRLVQAIGGSERRLAQSISDVAKSIAANETRQIKWMIGIGLAGAGLVVTVLRLLSVTPPS